MGLLSPQALFVTFLYVCVSISRQALGVIVFVLLCGCLPFDDDSAKIVSDSDARAKFTLRFPKWAQNLSVPAKDLLQRMLSVDPKGRITAAQALAHPWVAGKAVTPNNYLQSPSMLGKELSRRFTNCDVSWDASSVSRSRLPNAFD